VCLVFLGAYGKCWVGFQAGGWWFEVWAMKSHDFCKRNYSTTNLNVNNFRVKNKFIVSPL
jgi:hypothetical protein